MRIADGNGEAPRGTLFINAPKGYTGVHRPFIVYDGGGIERLYNSRPVKYCDGAYVFECPFDGIDPADLQHFLFKRQLKQAATEIDINAVSAGGSIFTKMLDILKNHSVSEPREDLYPHTARMATYYMNKDQVVGLEIEQVERLLHGDLAGARARYGGPLSDYAVRVIEAAVQGPDRSEYLAEVFDPLTNDHQSAMRLGYAVFELLPEEIIEQILSGRAVRNGDILRTLGVEIDDKRFEALETDGDL